MLRDIDGVLRFKLTYAMREYRIKGNREFAILSVAADSSRTHHALRDDHWDLRYGDPGPRGPRLRARMAVIRIMGDDWRDVKLAFEFVPVPRWRAEGKTALVEARAGLWVKPKDAR